MYSAESTALSSSSDVPARSTCHASLAGCGSGSTSAVNLATRHRVASMGEGPNQNSSSPPSAVAVHQTWRRGGVQAAGAGEIVAIFVDDVDNPPAG